MEFRFIEEEINGIELDLEILTRKTQRNRIMLYQHEGILFANNERIGNTNNSDSQFLSSIKLAKESEADLFMTPEYSCPWSVIEHILDDDNLLPNNKKLWVIGSESISLDKLALFKNQVENDQIIFKYDVDISANGRHYVDPLVYIFRAKVDGNSKTIVLVQFKTLHMGVWGGGDIERDNIILGNKIYILKNKISSIHLFTMICSEAMNLRTALNEEVSEILDWEDKPYLILHPQFNPKPYHEDFIDFRRFVFNQDHKEILSLNWQLDSKVGAASLLPHKNARSGFYVRSNELNLNDSRVNKNHKKGLYYFNNTKGRHTYLLSSSPHLYLIENSPLKIAGGVEPQQRRDGPEVIKVYEFKQDDFIEVDIVDDTQASYLNSVGCTNDYLISEDKCVIKKERLVSLSTGRVEGSASWWEIQNVDSFRMKSSNEINNRLTVSRNDDPESLAKRSSYCEAIAELEKIIEEKNILPDNIVDIEDEDLLIGFTENSVNEGYRFNVSNTNGDDVYVTICYIGTATTEQAYEVFVLIRELFYKSDTKDIERVVVYYKQGANILPMTEKIFAKIDDTHDYRDDSILKSN